MTRTDIRELLEGNIEEARCSELITANLTRVAKELLEPVRNLFGKSIFVTSGYRGKTLNKRVGGSTTSQHCRGEAADFIIAGFDTYEKQLDAIRRIAKELPDLQFGQLLQEHGCIHISLGTKKEIAYYDVPTKTKKPLQL